jgi:hypothetical protein
VFRIEDRGEPAVETGEDRLLSDVHGPVVTALYVRVLGREAAPVVGAVVRPDALHAALADAAADEPAEDVGVLASWSHGRGSLAGERALLLGAPEQLDFDERLVDDLGEPTPSRRGRSSASSSRD